MRSFLVLCFLLSLIAYANATYSLSRSSKTRAYLRSNYLLSLKKAFIRKLQEICYAIGTGHKTTKSTQMTSSTSTTASSTSSCVDDGIGQCFPAEICDGVIVENAFCPDDDSCCDITK